MPAETNDHSRDHGRMADAETGGAASADDPAPRVETWLQPNWRFYQIPHWLRLLGSPSPFQPGASRNAAEIPRAEIFDSVVGGLYALPAVQRLVRMTHEEAMRWLGAPATIPEPSPDGTPLVAYATGTVLGADIDEVCARQQGGRVVFAAIRDHDIPVPGVFALVLRIEAGGGGFLPIRGGGRVTRGASDLGSKAYQVGIFFNVTQYRVAALERASLSR